MISLDTETTGVDFYHAALPFFVTACTDQGEQLWWEWDVDPLTRRPLVPAGNLDEIQRTILDQPGPLVLQNSKFDVSALTAIFKAHGRVLEWPWGKVEDTLIAGHVLASNRPHDLTSMSLQYLGVDIQPYEDALEAAVQKCRRIVQQARLRLKRNAQPKHPRTGKAGATRTPTSRTRGRTQGHKQGLLFSQEDLAGVEGSYNPLAAWLIAEKGLEGMPSAKEKTWKFDTWLPRTVVSRLWYGSEAAAAWKEPFSGPVALPAIQCPGWEYRPPGTQSSRDPGHPWWTLLRDYSNADSAATVSLWYAQRAELERRGLLKVYRARSKVMPIAHRMEVRGLTVSEQNLTELEQEYREEADSCAAVCVNVASELSYDLSLPKGGINNSLRSFLLDHLGLPPVRPHKAKTSNPTLNAAALAHYLDVLPERSLARTFIRNLLDKRKRDTAIQYMMGYRRFWLPLVDEAGTVVVDGWWVLHPSLNPTGADTLRWSSSNPNEQNISKREGFNLRRCFGPAPGREWWSLDAKNIELRIPAYESGEEAFIALFERENDPPYFGSNHLLIAHLLHPTEFEACVDEHGQLDGRIFKKRYASTLYQRTKNGNFAVQYGAVDRDDGMGTADRTYGIPGAQARIKARFTKQEALNQKWIRFAEKHGYVETMPSKFVDPTRGYPIMCSRTEWGRIKPTVPLNYHVQSTAMEWTQSAMIRCDEQLAAWRQDEGLDAHMILQGHDELVFDFPRAGDPVKDPARSNLRWIRTIRSLMELGGDDIGVPTPVGVEYHSSTWAEGVTL
jgi:DNA polymerase I-like protein with 3'-5' exonuclease and polymerase domains